MKTNCSHCRHFSQLSRTATALWLACALAVFGMSLHVLADTVGVRRHTAEIEKTGKITSFDLNNLAWITLF